MANKASMHKHKLLDFIGENYLLKTDAAIADFIGTVPPVVSKIRSGKLTFGAQYIIRLHEKTGVSVADIKAML
jgi:hypothetical protein